MATYPAGPLTADQTRKAGELAADLRAHRLEVILAPAKVSRHSGHMVRVAVASNPPWYRALCASQGSARKRARRRPDTRIRRRETLQGLDALAGARRSDKADDLLRIIDRQLDADAAELFRLQVEYEEARGQPGQIAIGMDMASTRPGDDWYPRVPLELGPSDEYPAPF